VNNIKSLDRRDLILAVWAAEFTCALGGTAMSQGGAGLHAAAFSASRCADRAVEALRLLADVEFRIAVRDDLNNHYMRSLGCSW
jgi:hypothetical protein